MIYALVNISIIFLPLSIYLLNLTYNHNYKRNYSELILSIILIIEVILFIILKDYSNTLILINIPILISYLKRKEITSIILSILIGYYYINYFNYNFYFILLEYVLYFIIYYLICNKKIKINLLIYIFVFIKSITLSIEVFYFNINDNAFIINFFNIFIKMFIFYIISYLVFVFLLRGEEKMNLNTALKELEKEKVLRTSLFKMTHEIKNPIAVCKGYLDMLDINNKEKVNKYIPIIKGEIERTLTLMDDYLEYTKVKINKDIVDIYMLIEEVIESHKLFFKENNIKLKLKIPDDELFLNIDYNRIKQVLVNILKNAHEAMDPSKDSMIIKIETGFNKKYFKIIIEDNGVGMDSETLNNVCDLFFTTKRNGTGLGTSLSKEIIELHGGKIKYFSSVNIGTKVIVMLPLQ